MALENSAFDEPFGDPSDVARHPASGVESFEFGDEGFHQMFDQPPPDHIAAAGFCSDQYEAAGLDPPHTLNGQNQLSDVLQHSSYDNASSGMVDPLSEFLEPEHWQELVGQEIRCDTKVRSTDISLPA